MHASFRYIVGQSPFVRQTVDADGSLVNYYSFDEAFPTHVTYVLLCAADRRPNALGKTAAFDNFIKRLDIRYKTPAAHSTCNRILLALLAVFKRRCIAMFDAMRAERGQRFLNGQLDLWSMVVWVSASSMRRRSKRRSTSLFFRKRSCATT